MSVFQSLCGWLHEHPSRRITIRAAGYTNDSGDWIPNDRAAMFTLTTRLPDGRTVQTSVSMSDEVMIEPAAGDLIVQEVKKSIEHFLRRLE